MNNFNRTNFDNQMTMPPLPTGNPTGPQNSPLPPDITNQIGTQPAMPMPGMPEMPGMPGIPGMQMPGLPMPECPIQMDNQSGMTPMNMMSPMNITPAGQTGSVAPLPGSSYPTLRINPNPPVNPASPPPGSFPSGEQPTLTTMSPMFTPGFLRTQIGRVVRVEFLIGTSGLTDRFGRLVGVGTSYILIQEAESDDILLCDIYSIKFVRFYH